MLDYPRVDWVNLAEVFLFHPSRSKLDFTFFILTFTQKYYCSLFEFSIDWNKYVKKRITSRRKRRATMERKSSVKESETYENTQDAWTSILFVCILHEKWMNILNNVINFQKNKIDYTHNYIQTNLWFLFLIRNKLMNQSVGPSIQPMIWWFEILLFHIGSNYDNYAWEGLIHKVSPTPTSMMGCSLPSWNHACPPSLS